MTNTLFRDPIILLGGKGKRNYQCPYSRCNFISRLKATMNIHIYKTHRKEAKDEAEEREENYE